MADNVCGRPDACPAAVLGHTERLVQTDPSRRTWLLLMPDEAREMPLSSAQPNITAHDSDGNGWQSCKFSVCSTQSMVYNLEYAPFSVHWYSQGFASVSPKQNCALSPIILEKEKRRSALRGVHTCADARMQGHEACTPPALFAKCRLKSMAQKLTASERKKCPVLSTISRHADAGTFEPSLERVTAS